MGRVRVADADGLRHERGRRGGAGGGAACAVTVTVTVTVEYGTGSAPDPGEHAAAIKASTKAIASIPPQPRIVLCLAPNRLGAEGSGVEGSGGGCMA